MQLLAVCAVLAAAEAAAAAASGVLSSNLDCDCRLQHRRDWTNALRCTREQNGTSGVSCQEAMVPEIPRGYHYIPGYALIKLYRTFKTWSEAKKFCEDEGAQLAVPRDRHAYDGLKQVFRNDKGEKRVWWANVGITDRASEGIFVGMDGLPVSHLQWKPNEPNNYGNNEHCVDIDEAGLLNDVRCENTAPFLCERRLSVHIPDTYVWLQNAGRFYKVHTEKRGHVEAADACRSENAVLAVPDTWRRGEALLSLLEPNDDSYRIGFTDEATEGDFVTETGRRLKDMEFQVWNVGEPNNRDGDGKPENCLAISGRGYYIDVTCDLQLPFICEIAPI